MLFAKAYSRLTRICLISNEMDICDFSSASLLSASFLTPTNFPIITLFAQTYLKEKLVSLLKVTCILLLMVIYCGVKLSRKLSDLK